MDDWALLEELIRDLRANGVGYEYNDEDQLARGDQALALLAKLRDQRVAAP